MGYRRLFALCLPRDAIRFGRMSTKPARDILTAGPRTSGFFCVSPFQWLRIKWLCTKFRLQDDWDVLRAEPQEPIRELGFPEAAIESIGEFIEILLQILMADTVIGPQYEPFEIADDDVHPWEPMRGFFRRCDLGDVPVIFPQTSECRQAIGVDLLARLEAPLGEVFNRRLVHRGNVLKGDEAGFPVPGFARNEDTRLTLSTAPAFSRAFAAQQRIVQLNDFGETIEGIAMSHRLAQLAQHGKSRTPSDADEFGQTQCGDAAFVARDPIDRPEPFGQR